LNELDIFDPLKRMRQRERFSKFFDEDLFSFPRISSPMARMPLIDIKDAGNFLKITAELPGIEKKDLDINVANNQLSISAKVKAEAEKKDKGYYYKERKFQSFYRSIPLPSEVIPNKSQAEFKNGLLELTLFKKSPIKEKPKGYKLTVK